MSFFKKNKLFIAYLMGLFLGMLLGVFIEKQFGGCGEVIAQCNERLKNDLPFFINIS